MHLFTTLLEELALALRPLGYGLENPGALRALLRLVGTDPETVDAAGLGPALVAVKDAVDAIEALIEAPQLDLAAVRAGLAAIGASLDALRAVRSSSPGTAVPRLGRDLLELLAIVQLRRRSPVAYAVAVLLGAIRPALIEPIIDGSTIIRRPAAVERFDAATIHGLLTDPLATLRAQLPATPLATRADADRTADFAVSRLNGVLAALGVPFAYGINADGEAWLGAAAATADHALVLYVPRALAGEVDVGVSIALSSADELDLGVVVAPFGQVDVEAAVGEWAVALGLGVDVEGLAFGGGQGFQLRAAPGRTSVRASASATRAAIDDPIVIGAAEGTRLELDGVRVDAEAVLSAAARTVDFGFKIERGLFVATGDGGDGFLGTVMGGRELRAPFALGVRYTSGRGLYFEGGAGLSVSVPARVTVGPVTLDEIAVAIEATSEALKLVAAARIGVAIGPVRVGVEGAGLEVVATLPSEAPPRDFDLDVRFRPPTGASLAIDAGPVKGGGLLAHDAAAGRYTGALAIEAMGVAMSAVGVLDTAVPGGGYSLAAVIAGQFAPVPIGFGFTLSGVGGLIGIHRRIDVEALRAALRGPGVGDIFFAADPVAQVARLAGALGRYFPPAPGRHVIGPAVKLGWGTPTIVEAELGVLMEVPSPVRVVLVGSARAALPAQSAPIIVLQVDVVGEVDFAQRRAAIDATLRDSTVAGYPIDGALALRMAWGDVPSFVVSVGGFHSEFRKPPGFPELAPVRILIGSGEDPRLDITGFLALTSNTAQVGADITLYASAGPLNVRGNVGFEALFQFSPFEFRADLWAELTLRRNSRVLAGVHFDGTLSGPRPYQVQGEACLSLWFTDLCVGFSKSFGNDQAVVLPAREIWAPLRAQLEDPASWGETLPAGALRAVTVAAAPGEEAARRIDPAAALTVRQKIAPLERRITQFAQGAPIGPSQFRVTDLTIGGTDEPFAPVTDWFAPAQFEALSRSERLSRPGYERMVAGVTAAGAGATVGTAHTCSLVYETTLITGEERAPAATYAPAAAEQLAAIAVSAHARPPLRVGAAGAFATPIGTPPRFTLEEETFVIASTTDLSLVLDLGGGATRGDAELALAAHLAAAPALAGTLHVVPSFEAVQP